MSEFYYKSRHCHWLKSRFVLFSTACVVLPRTIFCNSFPTVMSCKVFHMISCLNNFNFDQLLFSQLSIITELSRENEPEKELKRIFSASEKDLKWITKMIFGDKISQNNFSENESSKRIEKSSGHLEPFSFSALHFLRNRLLPTGNECSQNER